MLQSNSRIYSDKSIKFYEQDIIYDDYIYTGDFDIALTLNYFSPGFGIGLVNSEGSLLEDKENTILFKMGYKNVDIIMINKGTQKTLATFHSAYAKSYTNNLKYKLEKRDNTFTLYIGDQKITEFKSPIDFNTYNLIYYSNKGNEIKNINIASSIPYSWISNMQNTNGGYIWFYRDGFEFKHCNGEAEIEQTDIYLKQGKYYLKYEVEGDCDIIPYIFNSDDERLYDNEKNMLHIDNSFTISYPHKVNLKFEGTKGKIKNICITTEKDNNYYRTSPDLGDKVEIGGSSIKFTLEQIKSFSLIANISEVPGTDHTNPYDYSIVDTQSSSYGLFDLNIAQYIDYRYIYSSDNGLLQVLTISGKLVKEINIKNTKILTLFRNLNAKVKDFKVIDIDGNDTTVIVENTIKKYVPGTIYSPIIVLDKNEQPLDLSSSYRTFKKNNKDYYWFTNVEREYFEPQHTLKLAKHPSSKSGSIIVYGIKQESYLDLDKILNIPKEGLDTIDACANYYDILFEKDLRFINKQEKEITLTDINDYKLIIVDYLKEDSYAINFRHELNSYEVDISTLEDKEISLVYNNAEENKNDITFINEYKYVDTKTIPSEDCYIVIGR